MAGNAGPRGLQRDIQFVCGQGIRHLCPAVRLHLLYPEQQSEKARQGLRIPFLVASGVIGRLCHVECRIFPGRGRVAAVRGGRACLVLHPQLERQGRPDGRYLLSAAAGGMVSLHRRPAGSGTPVAGLESERNVC